MRIYEIGRAFPEKKTGMIGLFEFQQAKALKDIGLEVHYIYFDARSIKINRVIKSIEKTIDEVQIHGFVLPIGGMPRQLFWKIKSEGYLKLLKKTISKVGCPDVVHIHFPLLTITPDIWEYLKTIGCKLIVTEHWSKVQERKLDLRYRTFLKQIYKEADKIICVSERLKESIHAMCGKEREIIVVPNLVAGCFEYRKMTKHKKFRFVSAGRLTEGKAFDLLIEAFAKAFKTKEHTILTIIGGGEQYNQLKKQIELFDMSSQIELIGFKEPDMVAEIYRESDCYVSASCLETFGVTFAEAWMVGLPCIGADNLPIKKYFTKENGRLFKVNSCASLANTLQEFYNARGNYDSRKIADDAKKYFGGSCVAQKLKDIFISS